MKGSAVPTVTTRESKTSLLHAAMNVILAKGYAGTIDDVRAVAGVTKGSFCHHFKSKHELASAGAEHFSSMADGLFATAPDNAANDPLLRVLGYVDFRAAILQWELPKYPCSSGPWLQEPYDTHPAIRAACDAAMSAHVEMLTRDIALAGKRYAPQASWSVDTLGYFNQSVLQDALHYSGPPHSTALPQQGDRYEKDNRSIIYYIGWGHASAWWARRG